MHLLFWLVAARVSGLFVGAPVFSQEALPRRYAILLVLALAAALAPVSAPDGLPDGATALLAGMVGEFSIGWCIGLLARLLLAAFQLAGTIAGNEIGLAMASAYDPSSGAESEVVGTLHMNLAGVLFLMLDGHHLLIRGLAASFQAAVVDVLVAKCRQALRRTGLERLGIGGGVAANVLFRERIAAMCRDEAVELFIPPPSLCTGIGAPRAARLTNTPTTAPSDSTVTTTGPTAPLPKRLVKA